MATMTINKLVDHPTMPLTFDFCDDGRTGYAYLHSKGGIVADVWLYNRSDTPQTPDWNVRGRMPMPYRNAAKFIRTEPAFTLPQSEADIDVVWIENSAGKSGAMVMLRGHRIAELFVGDTPGRSILASMDGPLARVMTESEAIGHKSQ